MELPNNRREKYLPHVSGVEEVEGGYGGLVAGV